MNVPPPRRPTAGRPRPASRSAGPLRDPRILAAGGGALLVLIVLAVLLLGPWSPLNPSDDGAEARYDCPALRDAPPPPDGFEFASDLRDFSEGECNRAVPDGVARISMPIERGAGGRGLSFYSYADGRWQRIAPAELTEDGRRAQAVVDRVPANGVFLRRAGDAFQVLATVPAGGALGPDAERLATMVGAVDYVPGADGSLNGGVTNLRRADTAQLVPVVSASEGADAEAVNAIVGQGERRTAHANALVQAIQSGRLDGIELAYTAVDAGRRNDFTDLVRQAADAVHRAGGILVLTLPMPAREGNNWNTGAYDWNALGKSADFIKIAPERDQSVYRRIVPEALTYLTGQVEPRKLSLTLTPLAAEKSDQGIRALTTVDALSIASQFTVQDRERLATNDRVRVVAENLAQETGGASGLNWDAIAATVAFTYRRENAPRTVWIENQYSAAFKAEFVRLWKLGGIAVQDATGDPANSNIWPAVIALQEGQELGPLLLQPNGGLLRPEWQVDRQPLQAGQAAITWDTPATPGTKTIALIVSDGQTRVQNAQQVTLRAGVPAAASPSPSPGALGTPRPGGATPAPTPSPTPRR